MPSLEITELILVILFPLSIITFLYIATKRKEILYYIPGLVTLFITFLSTNVEAIIEPDLFNFLEHFFILLTGILLFIGALIDLYLNLIKNRYVKKPAIKKSGIGGAA